MKTCPIRRMVLPVALALIVGCIVAVVPQRTAYAAACPTYHAQYDALINGSAKQIITARHRGNFTNTLPENSLGSFIASFESCQPQVETDVRLTKDGRAVIFHDVSIGKMLEVGYDPEANTGPNARLNEVTFADLRKKKLLTIDRRQTEYKVPTVEELLRTQVRRGAGSIVTLEVKESAAIIPTARAVDAIAREDPTANIGQRVVLKFTMDNYPNPQLWLDALKKAGISTALMVDPVMLPYVAEKIDAGPPVPSTPGIRLTSNSERAVAAWAKLPSTVAPLVSVVLKDSSEFINTTQIHDPTFGSVKVPTSLGVDSATDDSMARMHTIVKSLGKKTEIFVPVPDFILWRTGPVAGYTVPNTWGDHVALDVRDAYFNNTSSCCYQLADRRSPTKYGAEKGDLRGNLAWVLALEPTVVTADDTDSIEVYADSLGRLNKMARPVFHRAPSGMQSALQYTVDHTSPSKTSIVKLKGWNGHSAGLWQGQVCLHSANGEGYAWVVKCGMTPSGGSTDSLEISVASRGKMRIRDTQYWNCLRWVPGEVEVIYWSKNCQGAQAEWTRTSDNRYLTGEGRALGFEWQDRYYWGVPWSYAVPTWDRSDWTQWTFR